MAERSEPRTEWPYWTILKARRAQCVANSPTSSLFGLCLAFVRRLLGVYTAFTPTLRVEWSKKCHFSEKMSIFIACISRSNFQKI